MAANPGGARRVVSVVFASLLLAGCTESSTTVGGTGTTTSPTATTTTTTATTTESPVPTTKVPKVEGQHVAEARSLVRDAHLTFEVTEKYSTEPQGTVISQVPQAGREIEEGSVVTLIVAKPFPLIPNVVGMTEKQAERVLKQAGFTPDVVRREYNSTAPKNEVISELPTGGTQTRPGRVVHLVISKGSPPAPQSNCTPGYSPCLTWHGGADYDCYGGTGDGPYYTAPGVTYNVTGSDPYGLDADNDGRGCE